MNSEGPLRPENNIEIDLERATAELGRVSGEILESEEEISVSSSNRIDKISDFIKRNYFTGILGAGTALGVGFMETVQAGGEVLENFSKVLIALGIGAVVGKALDLFSRRLQQYLEKVDNKYLNK